MSRHSERANGSTGAEFCPEKSTILGELMITDMIAAKKGMFLNPYGANSVNIPL